MTTGAGTGGSGGTVGPGAGGAAAGGAAAGGGTAGAGQPSGVDLARVALRAAREQARARGEATRQTKGAGAGRRGARSGSRGDGRDPMALGAAINRLVTERGWERPAAVGGVMGRWPQIVGDDVANHCSPERYDEDERELVVRCDSSAWAANLRLLAPQLVARLNADLGHGTVRVIKVLGPAGAARPRYGPLRASGSRGTHDW